MDLDETIGQVSQLYRAVTGHDMPMSDTPYAPIPAEKDPVQHVQEQIDRLLAMLAGPASPMTAPPWAPPIAIYESASEVVVAIDVPGMTRDRIDVHLEAGLLVVAGARAPSPADGQALRHTEARFGTFRRVVPLPPGLRTQDMTARLERGVLEVRIPRDGAGGVRQVAVA
jgi:HSP20 family molecular chaperone IbpA